MDRYIPRCTQMYKKKTKCSNVYIIPHTNWLVNVLTLPCRWESLEDVHIS